MSISPKDYYYLFFLVLFVCCKPEKIEKNPFEAHILTIRSEFAPDKRTALFNIEAIKHTNGYILRGESDIPEAVNALKEKLAEENLEFTDSIQMLPAPNLDGKTQAVVNISVANLRGTPKHSAELVTQATLGTPVRVLKKEGNWYYIQTPDRYLSWVDAGGITLMDSSRFKKWKEADKIIFTQTYGHSFDAIDGKDVISDLVAGNILEYVKTINGYFTIAYPDGRIALVRNNEAESYSGWSENNNPSPEDLVATSKTLMGVPYLWGGTSTKGMDCSGFTKTVYFLNGMVIPRDASQQVNTGKPIDSLKNFENLQKGDLLFFGRKATDSTAERVVHVGMWIGNNEFIHASERVRIGSMDPNVENYDEYNRNRYLRTKRILREQDEALINLAQTPLFRD